MEMAIIDNNKSDNAKMNYAGYALNQSYGGRVYSEPMPKYRNDFERDRDRIIHSSAFRRLEYKTQVFVNHEGDLFRTRLTHTLEVAQIGRSIAKALNINSDLVEAICLAHDLGHTPFGHVGQEVLNSCLIKLGYDGFEHNLHSLRIVEVLEERYAQFNGLNLTFETKEGILKHCSLKKAQQLGALGLRFIENKQPSLEAQLANIADEIAYNFHDIDDGLRSEIITLSQLESFDFIAIELNNLRTKYPKLAGRRLHKELVRALLNLTIYDVIETTSFNLQQHNIMTIDNVREAKKYMVSYSEQMGLFQATLKKFLYKNLYKHHSILQLRYKITRILNRLFAVYMNDSYLLPDDYQLHIEDYGLNQVVVDYIAGMTDRYAFKQYNKLFGTEII